MQAETANAARMILEGCAGGFLMNGKNRGNQHGDGHGGGKHEDHHFSVLLALATTETRFGFIGSLKTRLAGGF
ncbi:MAG TPA: hypothetical protein VMF90_10390 [Rhizobiaceae bacterium]|nr:hypothetical protein [Rhizobiaceae bacterium]